MSPLFEQILKARHISPAEQADFLAPDYNKTHDPFLLPDMAKAVERLVVARQQQEKITIYGDYDIDGLTATTVLLDALEAFGFKNVETYIPNRFVEGYGLTLEAVEKIAATGCQLIITVDCGSLSEAEIKLAKKLGLDVIVTDHHNVAPKQPPAVAVINPKRIYTEYAEEFDDKLRLKAGSKLQGKIYPFVDLAGVGVAFKLVQALQAKLDGLVPGSEKWLLDLVALGTVCDVVTLVDENRLFVYYGLKVLAKTRRPGLRALMAVSGVEPAAINARHLGFALGPRMNAAGRLETARHALDMLRATDGMVALEKAQMLNDFNRNRRAEQDTIFKAAIIQAEQLVADPVLVVSHPDWNHGIIGIVAAKLLEKYKKPTFVLQELGDEAKGSARSYGGFSAADAIRAADDLIIKGGGHKLAAGVTLSTANIAAFRQRVNDFYRSQNLVNQAELLLPRADAEAKLSDLTEALIDEIAQLEPFGSGNRQPVFISDKLTVASRRAMGSDGQHIKLELADAEGKTLQFLAFSAPPYFFVEPGETVKVWYEIGINEWQGHRSVEGRLLHLEITG